MIKLSLLENGVKTDIKRVVSFNTLIVFDTLPTLGWIITGDIKELSHIRLLLLGKYSLIPLSGMATPAWLTSL